jgi:hypothetical protein
MAKPSMALERGRLAIASAVSILRRSLNKKMVMTNRNRPG